VFLEMFSALSREKAQKKFRVILQKLHVVLVIQCLNSDYMPVMAASKSRCL